MSLADWLPSLERHLPPITAASLARLRATATLFPATTMAVLELPCDGGADAVDVDFAVRLDGRTYSPALSPPAAVADFALRPPVPVPGTAASSARFPPCWLEFDWRSRGGDAPPILCLQVPASASRDWLLEEALPGLGAKPGPGLELWRRLLARLPASARPLYLFDLRARGLAAIRCELIGLDPERAGEFLRDLGLARLADLLPALLPYTGEGEKPHLSFDIGHGGALDRLGLENSWRRQPPAEPSWARRLADWVALGRLRPELASSLLAWVGADTRHSTADWPECRELASGWCVRALSHLKAAVCPGREVELKAYLLWHYLPRGRGRRRVPE